MKNERYERGLAAYQRIQGPVADEEIRELEAFDPDLARFVAEFAFGDILSRPGLDIRTRELVTIGMLAAMGTGAVQLEGHVDTALRMNCSRQEIVEVILQSAVYAGFPAALNAAKIAAGVFARNV